MRRAVKLLLTALALLLAASAVHVARAESLVTVASDGTVDVYVKENVSEGLNTILAPVEPFPATIEARINGTELVPIVYSEGVFYVVAGTPGFIVISYMANTTVYDDGSIGFKILNTTTTLLVRPGIVLLSLPQNTYSAEYVEGSLKLVVGGPALIRYVLVEEVATVTTTQPQQTTATTTTTPSATSTETATATTLQPTTTTTPTGVTATKRTETTSTPAQSSTTVVTSTTGTSQPPWPPSEPSMSVVQQTTSGRTVEEEKTPTALWVGVLAVIAIVSIGLGYFLIVRRSSDGGSSAEAASIASIELDDTDRLIIDTLDKHKGSMLQSEVLRETGLPKTTLWRHVRKLERLGYIRIVREGRANRLILVKKP